METTAKNYDSIINRLARESRQASWTNGYAVALIMISLVILATITASIFSPSANMLVMLFIFLMEGIALFIPVALYYHKAAIYMEDKCIELENTYPGIIDAYDDWKRRERESSVSTTYTF